MMIAFEWSWVVASMAAMIGVAMGLMSFCMPHWGASIVRLVPDPRWKGGWAEFRASYGGALVLLHGVVLITLSTVEQTGSIAVVIASLTAGTYWFGMALGRISSMVLDRNRDTLTSYNAIGVGFELFMATALATPLLFYSN